MWLLLVVSLSSIQPPASDPLTELEAWLKLPFAQRPALQTQSFAQASLSKTQAETARRLLLADDLKQTRAAHQEEWKQKAITLENFTMKFDFTIYGEKPADGRSLFISLHGGGSTTKRMNDGQWNNQKRLYQPKEGIYLAPRAPNDAWDMWFQPHMDAFFERLIQDAVALAEVNPNRVYLMGYSAGGDGVYRLAPRLADRWAAAAMMAGHPGDVRAENLRNLPFTLHVGELDTAFERNTRAAEWKQKLQNLHAQDPEGYVHEAVIQPGKKHWMDLNDAIAVPWMAQHTRNTAPKKVVWLKPQRSSFYWLSGVKAESDKKLTPRVVAELLGQKIVLTTEHVTELTLRLRDDLLNLDQPLSVVWNGKQLFDGKTTRTISIIARTLSERHDAGLCYCAEVKAELPHDK